MSHPNPRSFVEFDALGAGERQTFLAHVRGCADCRGRWLAQDPSRQFALLALDPLPQAALERLSDKVSAGLDRRAQSGSRRRLRGWGSIAATLLLAGSFLAYVATTKRDLNRASAPPTTALERTDRPEAEASGLQLLSTPASAQVVDFSVGETQVVMIFDEGLEL